MQVDYEQATRERVVEQAEVGLHADDATISICEGEVYRFVASSLSASDAELWAVLRQRTIVPGRDSIAARTAPEGRVVHVADPLADPDYAWPEVVASGTRTMLGVPLLREGAVLGTISLARKRVEPYTQRQIELVRTFADQAVIAMENARLLSELQARTRDLEEPLEYQTATSDVLNVISPRPPMCNRCSTRRSKRRSGFAAPMTQRSQYVRARSIALCHRACFYGSSDLQNRTALN